MKVVDDKMASGGRKSGGGKRGIPAVLTYKMDYEKRRERL